jgi:hypothetical protein
MSLHLGKMAPIKPEVPNPAPSTANEGEKEQPRWAEHVARTTIALAVLAAVTSGQNAGEFSTTILAQGEETDAWNYYQAKSIKLQMAEHQAELLSVLAQSDPKLTPVVAAMRDHHAAEAAKYETEAKERAASARQKANEKETHLKRSNSLAHAFIALQAGVILSTLATSRKNVRFWILAIVCGVLGLFLTANAYLAWLPKL